MASVKCSGKRLHYEIVGSGREKLALLHGNTASSRMFLPVIAHYQPAFTLLLTDFLGHGQSERVEALPEDLWFAQAEQAAVLLDRLGWQDVHVIGSSGGALVALNLALERPDLVHRVVADSFEGERALDIIADTLERQRTLAKQDAESVRFWADCHGADWEEVIDADTHAALQHSANIGRFFHRGLEELQVPVLFTASLEDEFAEFVDFKQVYTDMLYKVDQGRMHLFEHGGHPAMLSNGKEFARVAQDFLLG